MNYIYENISKCAFKGRKIMYSALNERINKSSKRFSKGQKLIADYITKYYDKAAFMTASKLGATIGVSESTVVRFATEIGYDGYPELQKAIQIVIKNRLTSVQKLEMTSQNIDYYNVLDASIEQDQNVLKYTRETISSEVFYSTAKAIANCEQIYIIAAGSSHALATFLHYYLNIIFDKVVLLNSNSEAQILQELMRVKEKDAVIGISFPRYSKKIVTALNFAESKNCTSVAITDSDISPLADTAKHLLIAKSDMASFVDSLVAPLSLINALIVAIAIQKKEEVAGNLKVLEDIWDEYGIYEKVENTLEL